MIIEKNKEEKEEWKTTHENEKYEVSNLGQIRNKNTKRILKKSILPSSYEIISLSANSRQKSHLVHRLVAQAFILNSNNFPDVNHKDRNKRNNRVENLEWVTRSMNIKHSYETGTKRHKRAVWRRDSKHKGKKIIFNSITKAAKITGCSPQNIWKCLSGRNKTAASFEWGYVKEKVKEKVKEESRKDIDSFEIKNYPKYLIYNNGQIYSEKNKKYLRPTIVNGYYRICLCNYSIKKQFSVHILVAQYFRKNPDNKPMVNHLDGNKLNNHYTNLEWVTQSENMKHADSLGLIKKVSKCVKQFTLEGKYLNTFNGLREAAEFLIINSRKGISNIMSNISKACRGKQKSAYKYKWEYSD
jgi:hypothetical protein